MRRAGPPTKSMPWTGDPIGDIPNAHAIPEDSGICLLCFGHKEIGPTVGAPWGHKTCQRCPLCKGSGKQTPESVRAYKRGELALDFLQTLA